MSLTYISMTYLGLVAITLVLYYILPLRWRWMALLGGSAYFYYLSLSDWRTLLIFLWVVGVSYVGGLVLVRSPKKGFLRLFLVGSALPLLGLKFISYTSVVHSIVVPLGLSFFTLQILSYLIDVYRGDVEPEKNPLRYLLYVTFFPQIIQGPIPRFGKMAPELFQGHRISYQNITTGLRLIVWGLFLKLMIADKAALYVNTIFQNVTLQHGSYMWIAGILYSLQLYTDFQACVLLSQGVALLFGIQIRSNFHQPYFATSIKDFWRRWHMSLSEWLRDYVYFPLGGNRKGAFRKNLNVLIVFLVSGFWHGEGVQFLFWGGLHGVYQIVEGFLPGWHNSKLEGARKYLQTGITFFLAMCAWIIFRAESLYSGLHMVRSLFRWNPWVLFDGSVFDFGLSVNQWGMLALSLFILFLLSRRAERANLTHGEYLMLVKNGMLLRFALYFCLIVMIWIFGTYGAGYDASNFIYGGF